MMPDGHTRGGGLLLALVAGSAWLLAGPHPPHTPDLPATTVPARPVSRLEAPATSPAHPAAAHQRPTPPTLVPSPPAAVQAVRFALGQLGKPYRWAAAGPGADDCSGLVFRAWRHAGLGWPRRSAAEQWRWLHDRGQDVAGGALQPGDLLVYAATPHDPSSIHHVALAVGAGRMVEAAAPGVPVRITRIRWGGLVGAARPVP